MTMIKTYMALGGALLALALSPSAARADDTEGTAICKDGSTAPLAGRATCSGRGGIDRAATQAANARAAAGASTPGTESTATSTTTAPSTTTEDTAATATIMCRDGTAVPQAGNDACAAHGGIDRTAQAHTEAMTDTGSGTAAAGTGTETAAAGETTEGAPPTAPGGQTRLAESTRTEAAPGGGPGKVWVNTDTKVYHCPGDHLYGMTAHGEYMTEAAAKEQGFRADRNKPCE